MFDSFLINVHLREKHCVNVQYGVDPTLFALAVRISFIIVYKYWRLGKYD